MAEIVTIGTGCPDLQPMFAANAIPAASAYPALAPIAVGRLDDLAGVLKVANSKVSPTSFASFTFFGAGTAAQNVNAQIVGYRKTAYPGGVADEYVPFVLADILVTLGATTSTLTAANKFASAIAVNSSLVVAGYEIFTGPANCPIARLKLDLEGCEYIRLVPGTGNLTNINGFVGGF